jgi:hypothetical protein
MHCTILGIDVAKQVFQLHGVDERGHVVVQKRVARQVAGDGCAAACLCDWDGGLWECAVLGAGVSEVRPYRQNDEPPVCETVRERQ